MKKLKPENVIRVTTEELDTDRCLLSKLINISEDVRIDKFNMNLERHDDTITFDLSDIFMQDCINVPTLDTNSYMKYSAETCYDLKSFIKALSWKNPLLVHTKPTDILKILGSIIIKMQQNPNVFYFYHYNENSKVSNICSDIVLGFKYEHGEQQRIFALVDDKIAMANLDQIESPLKEQIEQRVRIIYEAFS